MKHSQSYRFVVLRYVHDLVTSEFINVGVALHAPDTSFLRFKGLSKTNRLRGCFPDLDIHQFRGAMERLEEAFESLTCDVRMRDSLASSDNLMQLIGHVMPQDDAAFQWGTPGFGVTSGPEQELINVFDRMVMAHHRATRDRVRMTDDAIWHRVKREIEQRQWAIQFSPTTLNAAHIPVHFKHAWKNGIWHCIEPVSLDYEESSTIEEKAQRVLGKLTCLRDIQENFRVYLPIAKPSNPALNPDYMRALDILRKIECDHDLFDQSESLQWLDKLASSIPHQIPNGD
jgi:hypothetical protein